MGRTAKAVYFGIFALALLVAALSGAAMSWDGAYQFFIALDGQQPHILHAQRYIVLVGQGPALIGSQWTDNLDLLRTLFAVGYAWIPLGVLLLSWLIVKDKAPWLFLWPTLSIGLATLPGQLPVYSEATLAVQLFWPLLLALLAGEGTRRVVVLAVLAVVLLLTHPSAIPLLALASGVAFLLAFWRGPVRAAYRRQAIFLALVGLAALIIFLIRKSPYESEQLKLHVLVSTFRGAVFGPAFAALVFAYLAGAILVAIPAIRRGKLAARIGPERIPALRAVALGCIAMAGLALLARGLLPWLWRTGLDYRFWMLPSSLPFLGLATLEGFAPQAWVETYLHENRLREQVNLLVAVVFAVVLIANSLSWLRLTHRLEDTLASRSEVCIPFSTVEGIHRTALEHWSITAYSLVLQGRHPTKIILPDHDCEVRQPEGVPIADWYTRPWDEGWFDFDTLEQDLAQPVAGP